MGRVDLFHSRRTNYATCPYWVRDERNSAGSPETWVVERQPTGFFHAKPINARSTRMDVVNGVWATDASELALETDDEVHDISRGSVVEYDGVLWIVQSVQRVTHLKESEFAKRADYRYTLALVRGK